MARLVSDDEFQVLDKYFRRELRSNSLKTVRCKCWIKLWRTTKMRGWILSNKTCNYKLFSFLWFGPENTSMTDNLFREDL